MMNSITLNDFFEIISFIANRLLPVLFFVTLVYVIMILHRIARALKTAKNRVEELQNTISLVDENLASLATTTKSIANMSVSIDSAHEKSKEKIKEFSSKLGDSVSKVQEKSKSLFKKKEVMEEIKDKLGEYDEQKSDVESN